MGLQSAVFCVEWAKGTPSLRGFPLWLSFLDLGEVGIASGRDVLCGIPLPKSLGGVFISS
jgi:hypothetical protein